MVQIGKNMWRKKSPSVDPQLYFMHIPKTAGTTVARYIKQHFKEHEIIHSGSWNELYTEVGSNDYDAIVTYIRSKRGIFGHFANGIDLYTDIPCNTITLLRNPLERTFSQLCHIKIDPAYNNWVHSRFILPHENIADVIHDSERLSFFSNYQARYLIAKHDYAGVISASGFRGEDVLFDSSIAFRRAGNNSTELLQDARHRLSTMLCVGVQDYIEEFLILLAAKFGWEPPFNSATQSMHTTDQNMLADIDEKAEKAIENCTDIDFLIYEEAKRRFEEEYLEFFNNTVSRKNKIASWEEFQSNRRVSNNLLREMLL